MLSLVLALLLSAPPDPVTVDLQTLHQTVVADQAAGKLPSGFSFLNILPYVTNAEAKYATGTKSGKNLARSYMLGLKSQLPFVFQYTPLMTAADKALLTAQVDQVLVDLGP